MSRTKIRIRKGSVQERIVQDAGIQIQEREKSMDIMENSGVRYVYIIFPMEGLRLIGSLPYDFYEELETAREDVPLKTIFEDVCEYSVQVAVNQNVPEGHPNKVGMQTLFIKLGRYYASEGDCVIEVDKSTA